MSLKSINCKLDIIILIYHIFNEETLVMQVRYCVSRFSMPDTVPDTSMKQDFDSNYFSPVQQYEI